MCIRDSYNTVYHYFFDTEKKPLIAVLTYSAGLPQIEHELIHLSDLSEGIISKNRNYLTNQFIKKMNKIIKESNEKTNLEKVRSISKNLDRVILELPAILHQIGTINRISSAQTEVSSVTLREPKINENTGAHLEPTNSDTFYYFTELFPAEAWKNHHLKLANNYISRVYSPLMSDLKLSLIHI